jgi:AcrR family transcriptional regulator
MTIGQKGDLMKEKILEKINKEEKRLMIIDASEKLFFEKNYEDTTMTEIAKNAGIAKGTLYLYFSSKKDLYFSVVVRGLKLIEDLIRKNIKTCHTGIEKVVMMGKSYVEFYKEYPDYYNLIVNYESQKAHLNPEDPLVRLSYEKSEMIFDYLSKSIIEGIKDKTIRKDVDPQKLAMVLWTQTTGMVQQVKLREILYKKWSNTTPETILDYYIELTKKTLQNNES